ncbi:YraN family protein [Candidatus Roizmanbacteria bacterium]|nr:YraN family protein [Candidatus Roizmanbacteria bacterium]
MSVHNKRVGLIGENAAIAYLQDRGYSIIGRNIYTRWGELDIVAKKKNKISFTEVKTKIGDKKGRPHEAFTRIKLQHVRRAIEYYLLKNRLREHKLSLDVISVLLDQDFSVNSINFFEGLDITGRW